VDGAASPAMTVELSRSRAERNEREEGISPANGDNQID